MTEQLSDIPDSLILALDLGERVQTLELWHELSAQGTFIVDPTDCIEQLALLCGARVQRVVLGLREISVQAQRFRLLHQRADGTWLLTSSGPSPQVLTFGSTGSQSLSYSQLRRILGREPVTWLAIETRAVSGAVRKLTPLARLRELLRPERSELGLILSYSLGMGLLGLAVPIAIQALVNTVAFGTQLQPVMILTLVVLGVLSGLALLRSLRLIVVEMLQRRVFVRVTQATTERLLRILPDEQEQRRLPELVNRFFDVMTVQKSAAFLLLDGLGLLLQTLTGMTLLAFYHPFFLAFDAILLLTIAVILFGLGIGAQRSSIRESGQKYAMAAWLEELATHPRLFKTGSGQQHALWRTENLIQGYLGARQQHFKVVLRQNVAAFLLQAIGSAALLGLGGALVIRGELSLGQLVAAELIVAAVLDNFAKLGKHLEVWYDLMAALDKLGYLYDLPQEPQSRGLLAAAHGPVSVRLEQLSYRHPQHQRRLQDVHIDCPPGFRIALYDKHTWEVPVLLELLYGLRRPDSGRVLINGQPLQHLMLQDYRAQVALVRDIELCEGSLLENLRLGKRKLSREQARELLEDVGLWESVCQLEQGLDTVLKLNGLPLTLEDARRLMLARALAMQPRLLLIDGTLDDLAWQADGPLARRLLSQRDMTLIVRTQLPELLAGFDRVYAFTQGRLQECYEPPGGLLA